MAAKYSELLREWVKQREATRRDKNLVEFLAVREDIQTALRDGFPVRTIWKNMRESRRVSFGYDSFLNYVNRQIRRETAPSVHVAPDKPVQPQARTEQQAHTGQVTPKTSKGTMPGFTFNATPRKEDLI